MTAPLAELLRRRIAASGPIGVADYMAAALGHPEHGYYMTRDPLGAAGDFITAPEISQMFGELLGLWCAEFWRTGLGGRRVALVELGPGRGTLMADALRAARMLPEFAEAAGVHLVETSPALRAMQEKALAGRDVTWHRRLADVPDGPLLLVANEFFDALPVRQFVRTADGWRERMVDLDAAGAGFRFAVAPEPAAPALIPQDIRAAAQPGDVAETCPSGLALAAEIGARVARHGGAALIVDYGHAHSLPGETLQAVRAHERHDPLTAPGTADLTAHVDFAALSRAAAGAGARSFGPVPQGLFLSRLGIAERAERLRRTGSAEQARAVEAACHRLIAAEEMGTLFKVLAITPPTMPAPPGFTDRQDDTAPP